MAFQQLIPGGPSVQDDLQQVIPGGPSVSSIAAASASVTLTTVAVIPANTGITITVYEDTDNDGVSNASASQAIATGTNAYTLTGFANGAGAKYSFKADFTSTTGAAATLQSVQVAQVAGGKAYPFQRMGASFQHMLVR